jgi:hypothetical protein
MSERGMLLALQRIHDDPGFTDRVADDPENTIGLYDLDQEECDALIIAVKNRDNAAIRRLASQAGIDWHAGHIGGAGALDQHETSIEEAKKLGIQGPGALPGDGYEGVTPVRPAGT